MGLFNFNKKDLEKIKRLEAENAKLKKKIEEKDNIVSVLSKELEIVKQSNHVDIDISEETKALRDNNINSLYKIREKFMTANEIKLYDALCEGLNELSDEKSQYVVFPNVRLPDIAVPFENTYEKFIENVNKKKNKDKEILYNHLTENKYNEKAYKKLIVYSILNKHIDFLVCIKNKSNESNSYFTPVLAIELNGSEHYKDYYRRKQDKFKKDIIENMKVFSGENSGIAFQVIKNDELTQEFIGDINNKLKVWLKK